MIWCLYQGSVVFRWGSREACTQQDQDTSSIPRGQGHLPRYLPLSLVHSSLLSLHKVLVSCVYPTQASRPSPSNNLSSNQYSYSSKPNMSRYLIGILGRTEVNKWNEIKLEGSSRHRRFQVCVCLEIHVHVFGATLLDQVVS